MIIIDQVTNFTSGANSISVEHKVSSQDAVLLVISSSNSGNATSVTANGNPLAKIGTALNGGRAIDIFYTTTPPVGSFTLTISSPTFTSTGVAMTILGVNKNVTSPSVFTSTNSGNVPFINIPVTIADSLVVATSAQSAIIVQPVTTGWQQIYNETTLKTEASYQYGVVGINNITWVNNFGSGSNAAVVLPPAQAPSLWFPNSGSRFKDDIANVDSLDVSIDLNGMSFGNNASTFFRNSFLHTVGRLTSGIDHSPYPDPTGINQGFNLNSGIIIDQVTIPAQSNAQPNSFDHSVSSRDAVLVVVIAVNGRNTTSATFNGIGMTRLADNQALGGTHEAGIYYMMNPPVGTYTVNVNGGGNSYKCAAITLLGVDKSYTPLGIPATSASGSPSTSINAPYANSFVLDVISPTNTNFVPDSSQEVLLKSNDFTVNIGVSFKFSYNSTSMVWSQTSGDWAQSVAVFKPLHAASMFYPNISLRNSLDLVESNGLNTSNLILTPLPTKGVGNYPSTFWKNSFLHTVGRIINPPQASVTSNPAGIIFQTSQIVIDRISQVAVASGTDISIDHLVTSQDAVMVIFASEAGVIESFNYVALNGNTLNNIVGGSVSTLAGGLYYVINPKVGMNTISANVTLPTAMQLIAITFLGVDKKTTLPVALANSGAVSVPSTQITPASANSLLVDFVGTLAGAGSPDTSQMQYFEQPQSGSSAFGSIKLASASQQTMSWSTAGAAWVHFILALEPANALSFWMPSINARTIQDVILPNGMDVSINPSGNYQQVNGNFPSTFYKNSFLHTVGRLAQAAPAISVSKGPWRMMTGMGY